MVEDAAREAPAEGTARRPDTEDTVRHPRRRIGCPRVDTIGARQDAWAA